MSDERLRCGDHVRVVGPAATSPGDTFAVGKETTVVELRIGDDGRPVYACPIRGWGVVPFSRASLKRLERMMPHGAACTCDACMDKDERRWTVWHDGKGGGAG